ncbi:MAG: transposase [Flavobacteriaceae bacterium]
MTRKFKGKYRVDTTQAKWWNYARNGIYFVTIYTKNRQHFFGEIVQNKMILNPIGEIAQAFWREIPVHFPFVVLDAFVVMPNHIHGIIIINRQSVDTTVNATVDTTVDTTVDAPKLGASTGNEHKQKTNANKNWSPGALGVIINQYKRICTIHARKIIPHFMWQSRFYDHIIRNQRAFENIRRYIAYNPQKWQRDRNNQNGLWL